MPKTLDVVTFVHRPAYPALPGIGRIACIGLAAGSKRNHSPHKSTALGQSDVAVFVVLTLHLIDQHVGRRLRVYTTISDIHQQLANARRALNDRTRKFYAIGEWEQLISAIDEGRIEIVVLDDETRDDPRFRTAYELAHGSIVKEAREHARAAPRGGSDHKPCIVMTYDDDRLWEA